MPHITHKDVVAALVWSVAGLEKVAQAGDNNLLSCCTSTERKREFKSHVISPGTGAVWLDEGSWGFGGGRGPFLSSCTAFCRREVETLQKSLIKTLYE